MTIRLLGLCLLLSWARSALAQETYDVVTFTPPVGWVRDERPGSVVAFTQKDPKSGAWGRIAVYKSTTGAGNLESDFSAEWAALVAKPFNTGPVTGTSERLVQSGWSTKTGSAPFAFERKPATASLTTMSKGDRRLSILVISNSDFYQKDVDRFMATVRVAPPTARAEPAASTDDSSTPRLIGRWSRSSSAYPETLNSANWGAAGYVTSRYEFRDDGTYRYTQRSFFMMIAEILIVKEEGTFAVNGQALTVSPLSSVIESYTKKNGSDELGALKSSQRRSPEPVAYAATFNYSKGMKEWNLVLQANHPTVRDGSFAGGTAFANGWIFEQRFFGDDLTLPRGK